MQVFAAVNKGKMLLRGGGVLQGEWFVRHGSEKEVLLRRRGSFSQAVSTVERFQLGEIY